MPSTRSDLTPVFRTAQAVMAWLGSRAFVAPPSAWRSLGLAAFGVTVVLFIAGAWIPGIVTGSVVAGSLQPLSMWRRLRAPAAAPVIVLARFQSANSAYETIATVHIQEVERRLRANELLSQNCDIRVIPVPIDRSQAERIMRYPGITGVLSGSGLAVADSVRWEGWGLIRSPGSWFRSVKSKGKDPWITDRHFGVDRAEQTRLKTDAEVPASSLTAESFSADHAVAMEGLLLAHVAGWTADANPASLQLRAAAENYGDVLPLSAQAQLAATRVRLQLERDGDVRGAVEKLEDLGDEQLRHWRIWDYCISLMLERTQDFTAQDRLRVAEKGLAAFPDHALAQANVGATLLVLGRRDEARGPLRRALALSSGDEPAHFYPAVMSNSFSAGGGSDDWKAWRGHFRKVRRRDRFGLRHQLALSRYDLRSNRLPSNFGIWPD